MSNTLDITIYGLIHPLRVILSTSTFLPGTRRRQRVMYSGLSVGLSVRVSSKNTAVLHLTLQKAPQNIFKTLALMIPILGKTPKKSGEPCVECNGRAFQLASLLIGTLR